MTTNQMDNRAAHAAKADSGAITHGRLISVVIPTYNRAYCLGRTIESVLNQAYKSLELIVVDDGSSDDTQDLITRCYGHIPQLHYVFQPNRGVAAARNTGLKLARGDYIALLDSDDVWKPWKLQVQVACLEQFPQVGMIWTDMEAIGPQGQVFDSHYLRTMYRAYQWFTYEELFSQSYPLATAIAGLRGVPEDVKTTRLYTGYIYPKMIMGNLVHTSTVLLRRTRLEQVGGFNESFRVAGEDYDFHLRTCREGLVAFIDVSSIQYQRGMPDRLTRPEHKFHIAQNFLDTITAAFERDGGRISLPKCMLDQLFAETYQWIGEAALDAYDNHRARRYLLQSLRHKCWDRRTIELFLMSLLYPKVTRVLRQFYTSLKTRWTTR